MMNMSCSLSATVQMQQLVYYILNSRKADKKIFCFFYLNVTHYMKAKDKPLNLYFFFSFLQISKISE